LIFVGNSGGPVVNKNNEVIGVAFQSLSSEDTENIGNISSCNIIMLILNFFIIKIGYVIPVPVIQHFLDDVTINGRFSGVCGLGVRLQGMENLAIRSHYKMKDPHETGMI
jgi:S1-C subfamily serine protease